MNPGERALPHHRHPPVPLETVQRHVLGWFAKRGQLDPATAADMRSWQGTGGFSVDGSVRIEGHDRAGLERLVRCCARGFLALERLHAPAGNGALRSPKARLVYRLPEPDVHGRQELRLTPLDLLERLARLVPPPRLHRHRYHGVLAPNARLRSAVVSIGRPACGGEMQIISFITAPSTVERILLHLDLPHRPPRVTHARGPPQAEFEFHQTPAFDWDP